MAVQINLLSSAPLQALLPTADNSRSDTTMAIFSVLSVLLILPLLLASPFVTRTDYPDEVVVLAECNNGLSSGDFATKDRLHYFTDDYDRRNGGGAAPTPSPRFTIHSSTMASCTTSRGQPEHSLTLYGPPSRTTVGPSKCGVSPMAAPLICPSPEQLISAGQSSSAIKGCRGLGGRVMDLLARRRSRVPEQTGIFVLLV